MEQPPAPQPQPPAPQPTSSSMPQPTEHQQPPPPPPSSSPSIPIPSSSLPSSTPTLTPSSNPNPNPRPQTPQTQQPSPSLQSSQTRPPFGRTWQPQTPHFSSHLSSMNPPPQSSSSSSSSSFSSTAPSTPPVPSFSSSAPSLMAPSSQRGGMAIGVPAHQPSPPPPSTSFSSMTPPPSFSQQFGGLARNSVNLPDSGPNSSTSQIRQPTQGMQGMGIGMTGSLGSPMRPVGVPVHHQPQRPLQSSLRPQSTSTQNFQGHSLLRTPNPISGSPASPSPSTSQGTQLWLSAGSQGKPPLPSRPQMIPQQRSHVPQQQHHQSMPTPPPQQQQQQQLQQMSSGSLSQPSISHQPQENYGPQIPPPRIPSLPNQQPRNQGVAQKPTSQPMAAQPSGVQPGLSNRPASGDLGESSSRILSKRSIQELVSQIDPMEKLDPEVEDILMDIADEFIESITTFGCSLAKHRKSSTLEAKDILLHLERNWHMTLPGFGGDEIKSYKKPAGSDIHRERLAVIKKSVVASETSNVKSSIGQAAGGNSKGHISRPPPPAAAAAASIIGSPNPKLREAV